MFPNVCCMNRSGPHLINRQAWITGPNDKERNGGLFLYLYHHQINQKIKIGENCLTSNDNNIIIINNDDGFFVITLLLLNFPNLHLLSRYVKCVL